MCDVYNYKTIQTYKIHAQIYLKRSPLAFSCMTRNSPFGSHVYLSKIQYNIVIDMDKKIDKLRTREELYIGI